MVAVVTAVALITRVMHGVVQLVPHHQHPLRVSGQVVLLPHHSLPALPWEMPAKQRLGPFGHFIISVCQALLFLPWQFGCWCLRLLSFHCFNSQRLFFTPSLFSFRKIWFIDLYRLEGTLMTILFQPPCQGQGHLPLDQVA